jgi:hypothetical protein
MDVWLLKQENAVMTHKKPSALTRHRQSHETDFSSSLLPKTHTREAATGMR